MEQVDEAAETLGDASNAGGSRIRFYAKLYLTVLFGGALLSLVVAVWTGIIDPSLSVSASVQIGWLVEYVLIGFAALFFVWTASMLLIALPGAFVSGAVSAIARIADAYELPNNDE